MNYKFKIANVRPKTEISLYLFRLLIFTSEQRHYHRLPAKQWLGKLENASKPTSKTVFTK